jgi:Tol biopolymer transport system component
MGEVYLARDEKLERTVALKILPLGITRNQERVRRFVQEAKAASSLSHPHIVTIYEIGEAVARAEGASGEGEEPSESIHYIAMEHVAGDTLRDLIHRDRTDLKTLLRSLSQAADGLAKAHAAGIVHRDLKPENIMVSKDGYAKVLDFGLAKLTERQAAQEGLSTMPTTTPTAEGMVMGTVGYMSPEQVQAKGVDHRSDIFSFGCILYEAATRCRPFLADSDVETMHRILREPPRPIEELNAEVPGELRRLVRRCLAKSPDQRLQSMKDLAIELAEITEEYDALSRSSGSGSGSGVANASVAAARPGIGLGWKAGIAAAALVGLAGIAAGGWAWLRGRDRTETPTTGFEQMKMTRLASVPNLTDAALSPDGKYLATVIDERGKGSLRVKQVATGSEVQILPPQETPIQGLVFSSDGNYLYYQGRDPEAVLYSVLFQVPTLGGTPRKVLFDVDTAVTFSPDGRRVAFVRGYPQNNQNALMVAGADGSNESRLLTVTRPELLLQIRPSWSPDGKTIAIVRSSPTGKGKVYLAAVSAGDGTEAPIGSREWSEVSSLAWLPDGKGIAVVAVEPGTPHQIWFVSYPTGEARKITNDLNDYGGLSLSADGERLATRQTRRIANLWTVSPDQGAVPRQWTFGSGNEEAVESVAGLPSESILYTAAHGGRTGLWRLATVGGPPVRVSPEGRRASFPCVARRTGAVFFTMDDDDHVPHVWRVDPDGGNLAQITRGGGEAVISAAPDASSILIFKVDEAGLWMMPLPGGEARRVAEQSTFGTLSPDGRSLLILNLQESGGIVRPMLQIQPVGGGAPGRTLEAPDGVRDTPVGWAPTGDALTYAREVDGIGNIWTLPLAGGEPHPLTHFTSGRIFAFNWSVDGKEILVSRGETQTDVVLLTDFR